jgi:hypothetical protein
MHSLNSEFHNINMKQKFNFHQHSSTLSLYHKGFTPSASKYSRATLKVSKETITNIKQFKTALKPYYWLLATDTSRRI